MEIRILKTPDTTESAATPSPKPPTRPRGNPNFPNKPKMIGTPVPNNISLARIARDFDQIPIISRRRNGRIKAICGMGVMEFMKFCVVPYDTLYRMCTRDASAYAPSSRSIKRIVNGINILRNEVVVNAEWVETNFRIIPQENADPLVPNQKKRRRLSLAMGDVITGLQIMNKYNSGSIENIVKRHMDDPMTVETLMDKVKEKKDQALRVMGG